MWSVYQLYNENWSTRKTSLAQHHSLATPRKQPQFLVTRPLPREYHWLIPHINRHRVWWFQTLRSEFRELQWLCLLPHSLLPQRLKFGRQGFLSVNFSASIKHLLLAPGHIYSFPDQPWLSTVLVVPVDNLPHLPVSQHVHYDICGCVTTAP